MIMSRNKKYLYFRTEKFFIYISALSTGMPRFVHMCVPLVRTSSSALPFMHARTAEPQIMQTWIDGCLIPASSHG
jgi:hypothetical protein